MWRLERRLGPRSDAPVARPGVRHPAVMNGVRRSSSMSSPSGSAAQPHLPKTYAPPLPGSAPPVAGNGIVRRSSSSAVGAAGTTHSAVFLSPGAPLEGGRPPLRRSSTQSLLKVQGQGGPAAPPPQPPPRAGSNVGLPPRPPPPVVEPYAAALPAPALRREDAIAASASRSPELPRILGCLWVCIWVAC